MATRLFVGNLPDNTEENALHSAFSSYGEITNLDIKAKSAANNEIKKFAFVTISGSNHNIESCIKHFSNEDFNGSRLYVTRARESFLERLQRERAEAQWKQSQKTTELHQAPKTTPAIKLGDKLNPRKRKIENNTYTNDKPIDNSNTIENKNGMQNGDFQPDKNNKYTVLDVCKKKQDSEMKRMEAMKKKRQEFKQKQMILKSGLTCVDNVKNKIVKFFDNEEDTQQNFHRQMKETNKSDKKNTLFDDENENGDSGDEVNFAIKEQFEGKKGQKVLDLQSRYKSDKRFVLDERFIEDDEGETKQDNCEEDQIEINHTDEKDKQLNILQDLLGVAIKRKNPDEDRDSKKNRPRIGMLRFDPSQPEHAKFFAPVEDAKQDSTKKSKKKSKDKQAQEVEVQQQKPEKPRPEVSQETFYKVSDTLKEAIAQPSSFSLRSLFTNNEVAEEDSKQDEQYIPLELPKKTKIKNPLEPGQKNPFVYDSSDSEEEVENKKKTETVPEPVVPESKAVWKESFFFGLSDQRLEEGAAFFTNTNETEAHKERRELKSLMKKRIYNKERKDNKQMFQKKIGGRKKTMKKSFRGKR